MTTCVLNHYLTLVSQKRDDEEECKGVHSLMPNLGRVADSDGLAHLHPGFHPEV